MTSLDLVAAARYAARCDRVMADLLAGKPPLPHIPRPTVHQQRTVAIFAAILGNTKLSREQASRFADVVEAMNPSWPVLAKIWKLKTADAHWNGGFTYELEHFWREQQQRRGACLK